MVQPEIHVANMATTSLTSVGNAADSRGLADVTPCIATPNAGAHLPPEAEAMQERWLEAVRCSALFGTVWSGLSNRFDPIDWEFPCVQLLGKRWNQLLHIACICSGPKRSQFFSRLFVDMDLS